MEYIDGGIAFNCGGDFIIIHPKHYEHINATDYDKEWVITEIYVKAGVFKGRYSISMQTIDFECLKRDLTECNTNFKSSFYLKTLENGIELKVVGDGLGHFNLTGTCANDYNELQFEMMFDQTELQRMINEIEIITAAYPYDRSIFKI